MKVGFLLLWCTQNRKTQIALPFFDILKYLFPDVNVMSMFILQYDILIEIFSCFVPLPWAMGFAFITRLTLWCLRCSIPHDCHYNLD